MKTKFYMVMNNDDINAYLPSILNPRQIRKQNGDLSLTQVCSVI